MKIAALSDVVVEHFLIKGGTALACYYFVHHGNIDWAVKPSTWLNSPGYHGFSEMLYQYTSTRVTNNGSQVSRGWRTTICSWNVTAGVVMILGRYLPIIGPLAIAGLLAQKKYIPESAGTLKVDSLTFGVMTFVVIIIITALSYFPPLSLGADRGII